MSEAWGQVFLYCERALGPGLMAEPLNAASNVAFLVVAWLLARRLRTLHIVSDRRRSLEVLCGLCLLVGLGSFAFHTLATKAAQAADVAPIAVAMIACLWCVLRWQLGWSPRVALCALLCFTFVSALPLPLMRAECLPSYRYPGDPLCLNGSWLYVPAWLVLCWLAGAATMRGIVGHGQLRWAAAAFTLALVARSLDLQLCRSLPPVLHALWHIGAAAALYLTISALIEASRITPGVRPSVS